MPGFPNPHPQAPPPARQILRHRSVPGRSAGLRDRQASTEGFSEVFEIFAYVPQVKVVGFPMPLLICNVNDIDRQLIGWNDPKFGVNAHNVIYDLPGLADKPGIFSEVYHWPPPDNKK